MNKIVQGLLILLFVAQSAYAADFVYDEIILAPEDDIEKTQEKSFSKELLDGEQEIIYEEPIVLEEEFNKNEKTLEKIEAGIEENEFAYIAPDGILADKLTFKFDKGPIKEHKNELMTFYGFTQTIDEDDSDFNFRILFIKLGMMGKFRSGKENYVITANLTPGIHENFFRTLPLDAYIESKRIPNHKVKIGTFRPDLGYEGSLALFLIPLLYKTQIARKLSDMRKTGISIKGDYKYIDYAIEGFSSDTRYTQFFPGTEGNLWLNVKPLAKTDGKYGNLKIGGGYQAGNRNSIGYNVASAALRYDYKKMWLNAEFAHADGSNGGDGLTSKERQGYNITLGYMPTKKLELMLRFDDFDNDVKISNNNTKEYTTGFNYYIYKEAVVLMVNYSYLQNDAKKDTHRFIVGAQILI